MIIREAQLSDTLGLAQVNVLTWQSRYRGLVPEAYLTSLSIPASVERFTRYLSNPERQGFLLVAEVDEQIVGYGWGGPERSGDPIYRGELYALYVLDAYQGRGIGRKLMIAVAERLWRDGFDQMLVWVLSENPSRGFYEALGGQYLREQKIEIGGALLDEAAYSYDVAMLVARDRDD